MNYDEIKKYNSYIRKIARMRITGNIEIDDLVSAAYEKLCRIKIREKGAYKKYIEYQIRYAILDEVRNQTPAPYRHNRNKKKYQKMPEHLEFNENQEPPQGTPDNNIDKIYIKEKLQEIIRVATKREKQYIRLKLKDLDDYEIAKIMKITHSAITSYINNIKKRLSKRTKNTDSIYIRQNKPIPCNTLTG